MNQVPRQPWEKAWVAVLYCLLFGVWLIPGITGHAPWRSDEAVILGTVLEMRSTGDFGVLSVAGTPLLDRAPLVPWTALLTSTLFSPFLPLHDAARLASLLFLAAGLFFTGMAARCLYGKEEGIAAALLLAGSLGLAIRAHDLVFDNAMLPAVALAILGVARSRENAVAGGVAIGAGVGMAFLARGMLEAGWIVTAIALLPMIDPGLRSLRFARTTAVALTLALPLMAVWPALIALQDPALLGPWLSAQTARILPAGAGTVNFGVGFVRMMSWAAFPSWLLALWYVWRRGVVALRSAAIAVPLAIGAAGTIAVLASAPNALDLAILALFPPLAILGGAATMSLRRGAAEALYWFGVVAFTFFVGVFWVHWWAAEFGAPIAIARHLRRLQPAYHALGLRPGVVLAALIGVSWFLLLARIRRSALRPAIVWAAGMSLVWASMVGLFLPWVNLGLSYENLFADLRERIPPAVSCLAVRDVGLPQRALLVYHARLRPLDETSPQAARCSYLVVQGSLKTGGRWPAANAALVWEGHRSGERREMFRLYHRNGGGS